MQTHVEIRRAGRDDLPAAATLLARTLRFADADAIPAWLMRTTDECGGLTLVACSHTTVVGVSYAIPARECLFSCGLAVAPECRGRRLGLALKLQQRREAIALGYSSIRWTTDPINGRALRVYLSGLGAQITGYREALHDGLRLDPGHPQDDLEVTWPLDATPKIDGHAVGSVVLPWTPDDAQRPRVRAEMSGLLSQGYVGARVEVERDTRRCRVSFVRVLP